MDTYTHFFFLGSNPALSAAEVWRVLTREGFDPQVKLATQELLGVATSRELPPTFLTRLGGSDRIARLLAEFTGTPTAAEILDALPHLPEKWRVGLSIFGTSLNIKSVLGDMKRVARERGSRVKFVLPSSGSKLNTAQVLFNALYRDPHAELVIACVRDRFYLLRTTQVQDIEAYEKRDTARPARDAKVGMLPPKLAQIMINLALPDRVDAPVIFDPFCGMGTVLQEGWLMGYKTVGGDVSRRMVQFAGENLQWLAHAFDVNSELEPELIEYDARKPFPKEFDQSFTSIVSEPYLGAALTSPLSPAQFEQTAAHLHDLYVAAFRNFVSTLQPGGRVLFLLPAFKIKGQRDYTPLPSSVLDDIQQAGYTRVQLIPPDLREHYHETERGTWLYHRPNALVARELTLWQRG